MSSGSYDRRGRGETLLFPQRKSLRSLNIERGYPTAEITAADASSFGEVLGDMSLPAVVVNTGAKLVFCNDHFLKLTGWARPEVIGCDWFQRFVAPGVTDLRSRFSRLLEICTDDSPCEYPILGRSGQRLLLRWHHSAIRGSRGRAVAIACLGEDVTEHRRMEREFLEGSTLERRRLGAEMHDGLGQQLYGASLLVRSIETARRKGLSIDADLAELGSIIRHSMNTCREIAQGLSPLAGTPGSLIRALHELTKMPAHCETEVRLTIIEGAPLRMAGPRLDHLFRLAQEALANALKHAAATLVQVTLEVRPEQVTLTVADDGVGLPAEPCSANCLGLRLMRYRASMLHAELAITRAEPHGTQVLCRCPQML